MEQKNNLMLNNQLNKNNKEIKNNHQIKEAAKKNKNIDRVLKEMNYAIMNGKRKNAPLTHSPIPLIGIYDGIKNSEGAGGKILGGFRGFRAAWINLGNSIKSIF
jgi:hypothetical protein